MLKVITGKQSYLVFCLVVILSLPSGVFSRGNLDLPKLPSPDEYGDVFIDRVSSANKVMPVVFSHWVHRQKYTCRVCHVELNFSLKANDTNIVCGKGEMTGKYCEVCHNNKVSFGTKGPEGEKNCDRCHNANASPNRAKFAEMKSQLPRAPFGNEIDWSKALTDGTINSGTLDVQGDVNLNQNYDGGTGTVQFDGGNNQTFTGGGSNATGSGR